MNPSSSGTSYDTLCCCFRRPARLSGPKQTIRKRSISLELPTKSISGIDDEKKDLSMNHVRLSFITVEKLFTHTTWPRRPSKNLFPRPHKLSHFLLSPSSASCFAFCCALSTSQFFSAFIFINFFSTSYFLCKFLTRTMMHLM